MIDPAQKISGQNPFGLAGANQRNQGTDIQVFLKLMMTQLKNQDPTGPMESAEFAVQLATFSGVEQQARTNALLSDLLAQQSLQQFVDLGSWVGKEVRTKSPVWFNGNPIRYQFEPIEGADQVFLVVQDESGGTIARQEIANTSTEQLWMGLDESGTRVPDGAYSLYVQSYSGDDKIDASRVNTYSQVTETGKGDTGSYLLLAGNIKVGLDDIVGLGFTYPVNSEDPRTPDGFSPPLL